MGCEQEVRVSALRQASGLLSILPVYLTVCNLTPSPCLMVCVCVQFLFNNFHLTAIYRVVTRTSEVGKIRLPVCRSQSANSTRQLFLSPTVCLSVCQPVCLAIRLCNPRRIRSTHVALGGCDIEIYYRQTQVVREEVATRAGLQVYCAEDPLDL